MKIPHTASQAAKGVNAEKKGRYQGIERETLETHFLKSKNLQLYKRVRSRSLPYSMESITNKRNFIFKIC